MKIAGSLAMCLLMLGVVTIQARAQEQVGKSTALLRESLAGNGGDGARKIEGTKLVNPQPNRIPEWFKVESPPPGRLEKELSETAQVREAAGNFGGAAYNLAGKVANYVATHRWQCLLAIVVIGWLQGVLRQGLAGMQRRYGN